MRVATLSAPSRPFPGWPTLPPPETTLGRLGTPWNCDGIARRGSVPVGYKGSSGISNRGGLGADSERLLPTQSRRLLPLQIGCRPDIHQSVKSDYDQDAME